MDIISWLKLGLAQGALYGIRLLSENIVNLHVPYPEIVFPLLATVLTYLASLVRDQFGVVANLKVAKTQKATRPGQPPFLARLFGV